MALSAEPASLHAVYPLRPAHIWTYREIWPGLLFCAPVLLAYLYTLPSGVGWWDSGELIAAAKTLSIAHRPGFPLYVIAGRILFGLFDNPAVWANGLSAVCATLALLFIWRGFWLLSGGSILSAAWIGLGGWFVAFAPLFWRQSLRAEVYTPTFLALGVAFLLAVASQRAPDPRCAARRFLAAAFIGSLAFCMHTAIAAAAAPLFIFLFLTGDFRPSVKQWSWAGLSLLVGLSIYLYVPIRAPMAAYVWGDPQSWSGFWSYFTASDSYGIIAEQAGGTLSRAVALMNIVFDNIPWLLTALGLAGVATGALTGRLMGRGPLLLLVSGLGVAATVVSHVVSGNFDMQAYLFPVIWALWWGFTRLDPFRVSPPWEMSPAARLSIAVGFAAIAVAATGMAWAHGVNETRPARLEMADYWGSEILANKRDHDLIVLRDANTDFLLRGLLVSTPGSPEIAVLNTALSGASWYRKWWLGRYHPNPTTASIDGLDWPKQTAAWWKKNRGRVFVEYGTPGWLPAELVPAGWLAEWSRVPDRVAVGIPRLNSLVARSDPDWVRTAVRFYFRLGLYFQARGMPDAAEQAWDQGLRWAPGEPLLIVALAGLKRDVQVAGLSGLEVSGDR